MMLCIVIYFKYSAISDNKQELIQVAIAVNITTHKNDNTSLATKSDIVLIKLFSRSRWTTIMVQ